MYKVAALVINICVIKIRAVVVIVDSNRRINQNKSQTEKDEQNLNGTLTRS